MCLVIWVKSKSIRINFHCCPRIWRKHVSAAGHRFSAHVGSLRQLGDRDLAVMELCRTAKTEICAHIFRDGSLQSMPAAAAPRWVEPR
jgi:hypothetical protein